MTDLGHKVRREGDVVRVDKVHGRLPAAERRVVEFISPSTAYERHRRGMAVVRGMERALEAYEGARSAPIRAPRSRLAA